MTTANQTTITVAAIVNAPVEKVWQYWTLPEHITQWCQASPDWHAPHAESDLRPGGKFVTTMAAKDGSVSFDFQGTYTEVQAPNVLAYNIVDGRRVHITFESKGDTTEITETFDPEGTNPLEMQRGGWQAILDNFKQYAESL
ncbi:SRPBCC family protein [Chitinophaga solisilvae]|uniref:Polyketide cyclase n=1 Tax=Chitinophaga solisilvae TaxID=1233460 RepID=A0A3S1D0F4_9BACT|nr:SRPBCC family protein [Chitinophaga solisilvae]NSL88365.1 polyketide cyclase [Chitinophaga solisilvae]